MRLAVTFLLLALAMPTLAQEVLVKDKRPRPHWCRYYDWHDYQQDLRYCLDDRPCRARVRIKARRCGLIP